jgi:uncharacterized protein (DUF433 family)
MIGMDRIETNPEICSGKPVVRGTRILVRNILSMLEAGRTFDQIIVSYPGITVEDVKACVRYATELVDEVRLVQRAS